MEYQTGLKNVSQYPPGWCQKGSKNTHVKASRSYGQRPHSLQGYWDLFVYITFNLCCEEEGIAHQMRFGQTAASRTV